MTIGARKTWISGAVGASLLAFLAMVVTTSVAEARSREQPVVDVTGPYIELHSGPGRGFPVFHTVERGGSVKLLKRRTDWYRIRTEGGVEGWVSRQELDGRTGEGADLRSPRDVAMDDYLGRRVEMGFATGDFDGDQVFTFRAGYRLSQHFLAEFALSEVSGTFSSTTLYHGNLVVQPFTHWRLGPSFTVGAGRFKNDPKDVLVDDESTDDWAANAGVGVRGYLTRRFLLRADYRRYIVMVDDDDNDNFEEWTLGFSIFF